jgi:subtilase family serine protease
MNNSYRIGLIICCIASGGTLALRAQPPPAIREATDDTRFAALIGNTRPEATSASDRGRVADEFPMENMLLQMKRSPERDAALERYIAELHDPLSPNFHKWLTPEEFAESYGLSNADIVTVSNWLTSLGFRINGIQASGLIVDFSGTASLVEKAFHTEIHNLETGGVSHFANMSDPEIPAALEPLVAGIVSLHNFRPKPLLVPRGKFTFVGSNDSVHALVPGDIATIYNLSPLFSAGYSGKGQSIMLIEDTYLYSTGDWLVFRKTFGLTRAYPSGTLSQISPSGAIACLNPGFQGVKGEPGYGNDSEAIIDVEWATAAAPNAAIVLAACTDSGTTFGGLIALENVLNGPAAALPSVISISFGEAEAKNGATANLAYSNAYRQAIAEGISVFVSSGDEGAAGSDGDNVSTRGISIDGFSSTPYNVSVGGTDFGYSPDHVSPALYWNAMNSPAYNSALSYIQETPWNDSCAGALIAAFTGTTPLGLCNSAAVTSSTGSLNYLQTSFAGSGGPSGCATGTASTANVVSGSCAGYAKPAWQSGLFGNPADSVRDIPDVSLFASNGFWDAYYVACWSNPDPDVGGGSTCTGPPGTWAGFGGTSISSPIMAAIQVLVNQKTGSRWGNPDPVYYALANAEYGISGAGAAACNSNTVNKTSNTCVFYDITQGDNDVVCKAQGTTLRNCFLPSATFGVLSISNSADSPVYGANAGWDFATGIGSVNAYNLVMNWPAGK